MKYLLLTVAGLFCIVATGFAQKQGEPLPYNKERIDSLFQAFPKLNKPFVMPVPKEQGIPFINGPGDNSAFEQYNPGATVINSTSRGTVYNMPLDNMAVLVPGMNNVEKMPGSRPKYQPAPRSNMPNPLYRGDGSKKKNQ